MSRFYIFFILLWFLGFLVFIPRKYWSNEEVLLKESPSIFLTLFLIIIFTIIGFIFSKVLFATLCLILTYPLNVLEYNVLLNNFYTPEVEHLTPFSLKHFIAFFILNPLSFYLTFKGLLLLKVRSKFNQSLDLIKIQLFIAFCFISMEAAMYINTPFFGNFWRVIHNVFNVYLFRLLFVFSIFIGIILNRKFKTGKFNQFHTVIKITPKWLENVFKKKQILQFFILLGLLFLIPSYLRFYGSSNISHIFALFFNGVLLLFFGVKILPNLIRLLKYIINDEKFQK